MISRQPTILNRPGKFYVAHCFMVVPEVAHQITQVLAKLEFLPLKVEFDFVVNSFLMFGYSPMFEVVDDLGEIPFYEIEIRTALKEVILVNATPGSRGAMSLVFKREGDL